MIDNSAIDDWLDHWEELAEKGEAPDEKAFIAKHCGNAPPEMVEEFRRKVRRLQRMEARIEVGAADTGGTQAADTDGGRGDRARGRGLRPGLKPGNGYVLIEKLGDGGFGDVWKARSSGGHEVALKFVRLDKRLGNRERAALEVMRHVRHPHLLSCHRSWEAGGFLIIATDLADRTLLDRLRAAQSEGLTGIPGPELHGYMEEAAKAIDFLNQPNHVAPGGGRAGIQHRDIKPENILLQGGGVKVADFGLARLLERSVSGHTGAMTAAYAAPEVFDGKVTARSDQYSLAVTYCHLRGGRLPFTGSQLRQMKQRFEGTPDLSMLPEAERAVVARALARTPADRWTDCRAFVAAVRESARPGGAASMGRHHRGITKYPRPSKRTVIALAVIGVATGVIGVGAWTSFTGDTTSNRERSSDSLPSDLASSGPVAWKNGIPVAPPPKFGALPPIPLPTVPDTGEVTFCSIPLSGPRIVFVREATNSSSYESRTLDRHITQALMDMPRDTFVNIHQFGVIDHGAETSVFVQPEPLEFQAKIRAKEFVEERTKSVSSGRHVSLEESMRQILGNWPTNESGEGDLAIVCESTESVAGVLQELVKGRPHARPRISFVGPEKSEALARLVRATGGRGVTRLWKGSKEELIPWSGEVSK